MSCRELFFPFPALPLSLSPAPLFVFSRLIIYSTTRNGGMRRRSITSHRGGGRCGEKDGEICATIPLKVSSGSKKTVIKFTRWHRDHLLQIPTLERKATEEEELANVNSPLRRDREGAAAVFAITHANVHTGRTEEDVPSPQWRVMRGERLCV